LWIWFGWPLPMRLWVALVFVAGFSLFCFIALFVKDELPSWLTRALAGGTGLVVLIAAVMAVQGAGSPATGNSERVTPDTAGSGAPLPTESQLSGAPDPLTATLDFDDPVCEDFTVPKSMVPSLPRKDTGLDAEWIYEHGGATLGGPVLTVQGKSDDAVVLKRLRVVDLHRNRPPSHAIGILSCGPVGGDMNVRYLEVAMDDPPKIAARPAPFPDEEGKQKPAVRLPIKVSNSDPEVFVFKITRPKCFCEWRLAIDWTSGGRSGTMIVDHGFGKIRSDTLEHKDRHLLSFYEGKWQEL
jgi:hypothetical protein